MSSFICDLTLDSVFTSAKIVESSISWRQKNKKRPLLLKGAIAGHKVLSNVGIHANVSVQ